MRSPSSPAYMRKYSLVSVGKLSIGNSDRECLKTEEDSLTTRIGRRKATGPEWQQCALSSDERNGRCRYSEGGLNALSARKYAGGRKRKRNHGMAAQHRLC